MSGIALLLAQAEAEAPITVHSVWEFIVRGGPMMIPIGLASLVALTVIIERSISLRRARVIPPDFLGGMEQAGNRAARLTYCTDNPSPIANIFLAALRRMREPLDILERHIEQAGQREVFLLRKYLRVLSVIAAVSPLMGLLGTIFGMIRAFSTVASAGEALGRTELLAKGIYEAMITTAAGLLVAIPVLIAYHWFSARIERLVADMDRLTMEFVETHRGDTTSTADAETAQAASDSPDEATTDAPATVPAVRATA